MNKLVQACLYIPGLLPHKPFVGSAKGSEGITDRQDKWKQENMGERQPASWLNRLAITNTVNMAAFVKLI